MRISKGNVVGTNDRDYFTDRTIREYQSDGKTVIYLVKVVTIQGPNDDATIGPYDQSTIRQYIVGRGDWLGKPANFKGQSYSFVFEVDATSHVTRTVHSTQTNMADESDLFLFGDDFDAILEILETEDEIEDHFEDAVTEVSKTIS